MPLMKTKQLDRKLTNFKKSLSVINYEIKVDHLLPLKSLNTLVQTGVDPNPLSLCIICMFPTFWVLNVLLYLTSLMNSRQMNNNIETF